jgi:hypothetical protein
MKRTLTLLALILFSASPAFARSGSFGKVHHPRDVRSMTIEVKDGIATVKVYEPKGKGRTKGQWVDFGTKFRNVPAEIQPRQGKVKGTLEFRSVKERRKLEKKARGAKSVKTDEMIRKMNVDRKDADGTTRKSSKRSPREQKLGTGSAMDLYNQALEDAAGGELKETSRKNVPNKDSSRRKRSK